MLFVVHRPCLHACMHRQLRQPAGCCLSGCRSRMRGYRPANPLLLLALLLVPVAPAPLQEFSADMNSRPVKRVEDVCRLRAAQFSEDNGGWLAGVLCGEALSTGVVTVWGGFQHRGAVWGGSRQGVAVWGGS